MSKLELDIYELRFQEHAVFQISSDRAKEALHPTDDAYRLKKTTSSKPARLKTPVQTHFSLSSLGSHLG